MSRLQVISIVPRYRAAAAAGFSAVEVAHPYTEHTDTLAKVLQETGLKQVTEAGEVQ